MKIAVFLILCLAAAPIVSKLIVDAMEDESDWGFIKFILLIVGIAAVVIVGATAYFR